MDTSYTEQLIQKANNLSENEKRLLLELLPSWPPDELPELILALKPEEPIQKFRSALSEDKVIQASGNLEDLKKRLQGKTVDFKTAPPPALPDVPKPALPSEPKVEISLPPAHIEQKKASTAPPVIKKESVPRPHIVKAPKRLSLGKAISDLSTPEDLSKITIDDLRQGELKKNIETLFQKVFDIAKKEKLLPYYVVSFFEKSPANQLIMTTAFALMNNTSPDRKAAFEEVLYSLEEKNDDFLNKEEFDILTEFKERIGRII